MACWKSKFVALLFTTPPLDDWCWVMRNAVSSWVICPLLLPTFMSCAINCQSRSSHGFIIRLIMQSKCPPSQTSDNLADISLSSSSSELVNALTAKPAPAADAAAARRVVLRQLRNISVSGLLPLLHPDLDPGPLIMPDNLLRFFFYDVARPYFFIHPPHIWKFSNLLCACPIVSRVIFQFP